MDIKDIKSQLSILKVLTHFNIKVDKNNRALCPFHPDKTPSFQVYPKTNTWCCFSTNCNAGTGDQIQFIQLHEKCDKHQAIVKSAEMLGYGAAAKITPAQPEKTIAVKTEEKIFAQEDPVRIAVLTKLFGSFLRGVKAGKIAQEYIKSRALSKTEIGYNAAGSNYIKDKQSVPDYLKYHFLKENERGEYRLFAKYCIIFPLKNKLGQIVSLYGRSIYNNKDKKHFYLENRQGLYPFYPLAETKKLILTESVIDTASLIQSGAVEQGTFVLALYGTNGLSQEHTQAISELKQLEEIIFFLDGDDAGREAVKKHTQTLQELKPGVKLSHIETPQGEDINSLLQKYDTSIFKELLANKKLFLSIEENKNQFKAEGLSNSIENKRQEMGKKENPVATESIKQLTLPLAPDALNTQNPYKIGYIGQAADYYIQGGLRKELDNMKVTLVIESRQSKQKARVTKFDLYEDKQIEKTVREISEKLQLRTDQLQSDLQRLTDLLDEYREKQLLALVIPQEKPVYLIPQIDQQKCIDFLSKPELMPRLNELIGKAGVIGEEKSRIFLFTIASSYKMADTLHAIVQGTSGSGKTHLITSIADFMPQEDTIYITRATDSTFYNYGEYDLQNTLFVMEDLDGLEEKALLAFRELSSRGMVSSSTTTKDEQGNSHSFIKTVRGPIASMSATTKGETYEDNMNRSFILAVDESQEQTLRIIEYQNNKSAGLVDPQRQQQTKDFIKNCVRLLKPLQVVNSYANKVHLPLEARNLRRLNAHYQSIIRQVTLLNQYQRKMDDKERLITEKEDLQMACDIMFDSIILKIDELDGPLRSFYEELKKFVKRSNPEGEFSAREIRHVLNMSKSSVQRNIWELLRLEYITHSGGFINRGLRYKIQYWDDIKAIREKIKKYLYDQLSKL
jgi:DNA primase